MGWEADKAKAGRNGGRNKVFADGQQGMLPPVPPWVSGTAELERDIAKSFSVPKNPGEVFRITERGRQRYMERHPKNIPPYELFEDENGK